MKRDVGCVTVLINNAGIVTGKKLFDASDKMIDLTFRVNTIAHFWVGPPAVLSACSSVCLSACLEGPLAKT